MRLTVVGCSGSVPGPDSAASCYLVQADGFTLVLDLGSGALGPLQRHVDLASIDAVLLSHLHPDHMLDLAGLTVALTHGPRTPAAAIPVHGPPALPERLREVLGLRDAPGLADVEHLVDVRPVVEGTTAVGPFLVSARLVDHPVEAYAYRVEHDGRALAFSGDCAPCPGLDDIANAADLLLVEAAFGTSDPSDNPPHLHHTAHEAGELARRAGVGRMVVTHVPPWHDRDGAVSAAAEVYGGPVEAARPHAAYEV